MDEKIVQADADIFTRLQIYETQLRQQALEKPRSIPPAYVEQCALAWGELRDFFHPALTPTPTQSKIDPLLETSASFYFSGNPTRKSLSVFFVSPDEAELTECELTPSDSQSLARSIKNSPALLRLVISWNLVCIQRDLYEQAQAACKQTLTPQRLKWQMPSIFGIN